MIGNPYMNSYGFPQSYPQFPQQEKQQPIQNIFTNQMPTTNDYFMAKFLKENQTPETEIVTQKTAFIDLQNKKLSIKEVDGSIKKYEIVLPLDEKDMKIQELENTIKQLKGMMDSEQSSITTTNIEISKPDGNVKKFGRK